MLALLRIRAELPAFARFHMTGHWAPDGRRMTESIRHITMQYGRAPRVGRLRLTGVGVVARVGEARRGTGRRRWL